MIDDIKTKEASDIYIWRSKCPTSLDQIKRMMEKETNDEEL